MKVLVIGSGGREHALALALSRDPEVSEVHAAPGNPGIAAVAELHDVKADDGTAVADLAEGLGIDLVVIGLRRRTPVGKLLMGSVAQRILLGAECAVLAVKPKG